MKKLFWLSLVIAVLAAFFASANPDGLDFVAEKLGFAERGQERAALLPYSAGVAGVLITLSIFWLSVYMLKGRGLLTASAPPRAKAPN